MKHLHVFLVLLAMLSTALAQDTWTVAKAIQRVLEQHPAIEQGEKNIQASEARTLQVSSARYPDIATEASFTYLSPIVQLTFPGLGEFKLYPADNYDVHVGGRYMVYDFGKTKANIRASESRIESLRDMVEWTKNNLSYQTIRVYYSILFLGKSIKVQDEQIAAFEQHMSTTQRRVASGTATNFDVLTTQVRLASAQNFKIDLANTLHKQCAVLNQLLGFPPDQQVSLQEELTIGSVPANTDSLLQMAIRQRLEIKLSKDAEKSAQLSLTAVSLVNKPNVRFSLAYGFKNGYIPDLEELRGNLVARASADVPLFDGWRTEHQRDEARANIEAEQAHRKELESQIRSEVEQAVADVRSASEKIGISDLQVQQATEAVSIARLRYENGTVTNLDLLDAQTAESAAMLGKLQAIYRLVLNQYELKRVLGNNPLE
jgi:outer membrane protein